MIQWHFIEQLFPTPEWQILESLLGNDEVFLCDIGYRVKPYGSILIAQAYDFPYHFYGIQTLYPEKDRFLVNLTIPDQIKAQPSYERRFAYKFASRSFEENDRLSLSLFRITSS